PGCFFVVGSSGVSRGSVVKVVEKAGKWGRAGNVCWREKRLQTATNSRSMCMVSKEIDHIAGGVAATNFGIVRVEQLEAQELDRTNTMSTMKE
nr:hypothetical protein [Tanacetum cinerariifolium]